MNKPKIVLFKVKHNACKKENTDEYLATLESNGGYKLINDTADCYVTGPTIEDNKPYTLEDIRYFFTFYLRGKILLEETIE